MDSKDLANSLAQGSIVTKALGRYLYQILEEVDRNTIRPLEAENRRYKDALEFIAKSPVTTSHVQRARAALQSSKRGQP